MDKILIPVDKFSELSLTAIHYALEFAKRSGSKPVFLFFAEADPANSVQMTTCRLPEDKQAQKIKEKIAQLLDLSIMNGVAVEQHKCHGEYIERLCRFTREFHIAAIVIALPNKKDELYDKIKRDISLLVQMTPCRVLTVREKNNC